MRPPPPLLTLVAVVAAFLLRGEAKCYFPVEYQGVYATQSVASNVAEGIQYSEVVILPDTIPIWGDCHSKVKSGVILLDRSSNVLEVHTEAIDKCYTHRDAALMACPQQRLGVANREFRSYMLFKTKQLNEVSATMPATKTLCPFDGRYVFTYVLNDGNRDVLLCSRGRSRLDNCPDGSSMNMQYRQCSFGDLDASFSCLGSWDGLPGDRERYVAFLDNGVADNDGRRPRYRCGKMAKDPLKGTVFLTLSADSSCLPGPASSFYGFESFVLTPEESQSWPSELQKFGCSFPGWLQGNWGQLQVHNGTVEFVDEENLLKMRGYCLRSSDMEQHFLVSLRSHCGDHAFGCMLIRKRSENVVEYQTGSKSYSIPVLGLCDPANFDDNRWKTQGKILLKQESPCPIAGEYTGLIPNAPGLCAKLSSDCNNPQIMFFTISNCYNRSEVYEDREYRCLGQWAEKNLVYTYTQRKDIEGYECFVGTKREGESKVYITEAGSNCQRGKDPYLNGMKLLKREHRPS